MDASVFVYERIDPTEASLKWLAEQGVTVEAGHSMFDHPPRRYGSEEFLKRANEHAAVMGSSGQRFTRETLDQLPNLLFIAKCGIGVDNIDLAAATERGIQVTNTPIESDVEAVCEHAIGMMLGLLKQFRYWSPEFMRAGGWRGGLAWAELLMGRTVGTIGMGRIGRGIARRLGPWNVRAIAYDPRIGEAVKGVQMVDLATLLAESDIVSVNAVATPDNRHLIDAKAIAQMKDGAILVNTARGALVNLDDLAGALRDGKLAGAGLDVYEIEPPDPRHPLFTLPNVITTPHTAAWTKETLADIGWSAARSVSQMVNGQRPEHLVNTDVLDQLKR